MLREPKGKTESDLAFVKEKLQEAAKGPEAIKALINLADISAYEDQELGDLALEIGRPLLQQVEPQSRRT